MRVGRLLLPMALLMPLGIALVASCAASKPAGALPCTYFVSPSGSDANDGTSASKPFATLEKARSAARHKRSSAICLRAGLYRRTMPLELSSADDGESWRYNPPDGVNSAVLDGGGQTDIIHIVGGSSITFDGIKMQNFRAIAIHTQGGRNFGVAPTSGNTVENCDIGFNTVTDWNSGAFFSEGSSPQTMIRNNYVHDLGSQGIAINTYFSPDDSVDGSVIANNVVIRTVQRKSDGGAIYVGMHGGSQDSHVVVTNNFVRDYGAPGVSAAVGIYFDDNASNAKAFGNIVGPPIEGSVGPGHFGAGAFEVHNGNRNEIYDNIVDLGDSGRVIAVLWFHGGEPIDFGMAGNTFTRNIVVSSYTGRQRNNFGGVTEDSFIQNLGPAANYLIARNIYHNYAGGVVNTAGTIAGDAAPSFMDPELSGETHSVADGSPVLRSPINFPAPARGWGPPGFTIPKADNAATAR